jgi:hypothetical protein
MQPLKPARLTLHDIGILGKRASGTVVFSPPHHVILSLWLLAVGIGKDGAVSLPHMVRSWSEKTIPVMAGNFCVDKSPG